MARFTLEPLIYTVHVLDSKRGGEIVLLIEKASNGFMGKMH